MMITNDIEILIRSPEMIINTARSNIEAFEKVLKESSPFEIKGILNSEMLLLVTLLKFLKIQHVIESGRARGQSTEILARWLVNNSPNVKFESIEYDKSSEDVKVAEERIKNTGFPAKLLYGDACTIIPQTIKKNEKERKFILIDGPKGIKATYLAIQAMSDPNVLGVCIHDIHQDAGWLRDLLNKVWPSNFASDCKDYVKAFQYLDGPCWEEHQKYQQFFGWGPYKRGDRVMKSYGPTLVCLINAQTSQRYKRAYKAIRRIYLSNQVKVFIKKLIFIIQGKKSLAKGY